MAKPKQNETFRLRKPSVPCCNIQSLWDMDVFIITNQWGYNYFWHLIFNVGPIYRVKLSNCISVSKNVVYVNVKYAKLFKFLNNHCYCLAICYNYVNLIGLILRTSKHWIRYSWTNKKTTWEYLPLLVICTRKFALYLCELKLGILRFHIGLTGLVNITGIADRRRDYYKFFPI